MHLYRSYNNLIIVQRLYNSWLFGYYEKTISHINKRNEKQTTSFWSPPIGKKREKDTVLGFPQLNLPYSALWIFHSKNEHFNQSNLENMLNLTNLVKPKFGNTAEI